MLRQAQHEVEGRIFVIQMLGMRGDEHRRPPPSCLELVEGSFSAHWAMLRQAQHEVEGKIFVIEML